MAKITRSDGTTREVSDEDVWGPPPTEREITEQRLEDAKTECRKRIYAVVDQIAQVNLAADAAAERMSPTDLLTYRNGLEWVEGMRANCRRLAADHRADIAADDTWPAVPDGVAELAERY
jgi:hypothetical protein